MRTIETKQEGYSLTCPYCGHDIERLSCREEQTPHTGDFMVCPCGGVGVMTNRHMFGRGWRIRKPTYLESRAILEHTGVQAILYDWGIY